MYRKDSVTVGEWIKNSNKALLVTGARQIGKTCAVNCKDNRQILNADIV